jgi:hypothetical protein
MLDLAKPGRKLRITRILVTYRPVDINKVVASENYIRWLDATDP